MPENRTFQMPITASDPDGQPLKFVAKVSSKSVTAVFGTNSNPSLVINVSGVDATNGAFTGDMVLQLFQDLTPLTTARIIDLVNSNFYNGLIFHRVVQDFVAQGGDPTGTGTGGSGVDFDDEFVKSLTYDGFGQLGMANSGHDSNDSQFFITDVDLSVGSTNKPSPEHLNFQNTIFGQLTSGFDVLAKLISTPVDGNDKPLTSNVMNTVTITNSQDGVLRLTAAPKFLGTVTVTVTATNAENQFASTTFTVKVITNAVNSAPFLGPIPAVSVATQNTAASFILKTTDIDGDQTSLGLEDTDTGQFPTNLVATINPVTHLLYFSPDLSVTGDVHLIIGVRDATHNFDSQRFNLTYLPRSAMPTMSITSMKGTVSDVGTPFGDKVKVSGTFSFIGDSDGTFGSNDVMVLTAGNPAQPVQVRLVPGNTGYTFKKGVLKAKGIAISGNSSNVITSAQFNGVKKTFQISLSNFNFPVAVTNNQIQLDMAVGNDYTSNVVTWVEKKPGLFVPPVVP